ncbi:hypothetical protein FWK35_00034511 [Aphis craccivora]|uniref:Uncharacterized protein n=1 Tax=Aphis craccivora TaxID=307492 RepID=A0A6G0Y2R2_APHCR|nr:hypothetical protein FWK35_00034511 [Aphis craccivora]
MSFTNFNSVLLVLILD